MYFQACIRCGATSTPLWRPEVLAGPKVLCNACGVKVLYPIKAKKPKPDNGFSMAAQHPAASNKLPQQLLQLSASMPSHKLPRSQFDGGGGSKRESLPASSKRQKVHPPAMADVRLSPAQKQHIEVERQFDSSGSKIIRWIITDCTINDTRDFDQLTHAQAFIDECWMFISAELR